MKTLILQFFTWWNGATWGTRFYTWRNGERVGEDDFGNVYYRNSDDSRRWVLYADQAEASQIPSGWHGWMHHKVDVAPSDQDYEAKNWQLPHKPNMTGTAGAYVPPTSLLKPEPKTTAGADYEAWTP